MRKTGTFALSLLLISLAIAPAYAKRHGGENQRNYDGKRTEQIEQIKEELDLTSQQEMELKEIIAESREETTLLRKRTKANKKSIREIFDAETLDEPRLRELSGVQAELHADMMVAKHAMRTRVNQVLTPEQQEKRQELRKERKRLQRHSETGRGKADM